VNSYFLKATCILPSARSGSQSDDDPVGSTHVAELFYKVVFDGYLFIPYFIVQHNGMPNFKIGLN
jgi:hypothetical protein